MAEPRAILRFISRNGKRAGVTVVGFILLTAGVVMLITPGPGLGAIVAGLAILSTEYVWAQRALERAREKGRQAVRRVRGGPQPPERGAREVG